MNAGASHDDSASTRGTVRDRRGRDDFDATASDDDGASRSRPRARTTASATASATASTTPPEATDGRRQDEEERDLLEAANAPHIPVEDLPRHLEELEEQWTCESGVDDLRRWGRERFGLEIRSGAPDPQKVERSYRSVSFDAVALYLQFVRKE